MYLFFISAKDSINSTLLDDMFDGLACNIVRNFILGEHVSIEDTMDYIKTFASKRRCLKDGSPVTSENFNIGFNTKLASAKLGGSLLRGYEFIMQPSKYKPSEDKSSKGKSYSFIQVSDSLSGDMAITYNVKWLALPITGKNNKVGLNTAEDLYSKVRLNVLSDFPHVGKLYLDCIGLNLTEDNLNAFGNEVSRVFKSYLNIS